MAPSDLFINLGLSQKRKLTDLPYLLMFATFLVILTIFAIIYTACSSDLNDGVANEYVLEELNDNFGFLAIVCCIGLGLSVIALFCFRYFVNIFIWTMLIVTVLLTCALAGFFWYISAQSASHNQIIFKIAAIILTAFSLITATCILVWNEQIKLLIKFYEEAIKIVFAMPLIFLVSLLTSISVLVIAVLCRYMIVLLDNSGGPLSGFFLNTKTYDGVSVGMIMEVFVVLVFLWMVEFVLVCQQMVISGAVATYYFTRDKTALVSPIYTSFYNLMRYHLGSAVYGSIIFLVTAQNNYFVHVCCCSRLKNSLQYPTPKGLIVTAIRGEPLCQSSVRGATLVDSNFLSAVAKSSAGTFVFSTMQLLVLNITAIIGLFMIHSVQSVLIGAVFALVCAHCIFVVFQIAVDTLFICYCEDYCLNNGTNEPFYATAELRQKVKEVQDFTKSIEEKRCVC